jgi:diguanylate cyclase (GGDEF)-like protein/PAS domain S-box-containing protein
MKSKKPEQKKPSELRKRAEEKLKTKKPPPKIMSDKETQQLIHELQVHQIELEMQNEELRKAQSELEKSRAKYSDLYDFAPVGYFTFDKQGLILEVNLTAARELGMERSLFINKPFRAYIVTDDRKLFDEHLQKVFKSADRQTCEIRLKRKNGSEFYAQLESIATHDMQGNTLSRTSAIDITERKQIEEKLKTASNEWRATFDASSDPIMLIDSEMKIIKANLATTKYLLKPFNEILGKTYFELFQGTDRPPAECPLEKMKKTKKHQEAELYLSERYMWVRVSFDPIFDDKGNLIMFVHIISDITESKHAEEKLRKLATTDKLTKAYNRIKFEEIIEREIERVKRYNQPLSMIMFDIDHFKKINDTYGHSAGDYVLKTIADIVRETIRKIDYLIRWGGEEFVIISSETNLEKAYVLAERIRGITESYKFDTIGKVTASFGVTEFKEGDTKDSLIRRMDNAMYSAKKKGRNRVEESMKVLRSRPWKK